MPLCWKCFASQYSLKTNFFVKTRCHYLLLWRNNMACNQWQRNAGAKSIPVPWEKARISSYHLHKKQTPHMNKTTRILITKECLCLKTTVTNTKDNIKKSKQINVIYKITFSIDLFIYKIWCYYVFRFTHKNSYVLRCKIQTDTFAIIRLEFYLN